MKPWLLMCLCILFHCGFGLSISLLFFSWLVEMGKWPLSCCMWSCFCKQRQCILMASLCNSNPVLNDLILKIIYKEYVWGLSFKLINKYGDLGESKHCHCCRSHWIIPLMSTSIPFVFSLFWLFVCISVIDNYQPRVSFVIVW